MSADEVNAAYQALGAALAKYGDENAAALAERDAKIEGQATTLGEQSDEIADLKRQLAEALADDVATQRRALAAVQVFPHRKDFPLYRDFPRVLAALDDLGVKHVRGQLGPNTEPDVIEFYRAAYADHGVTCMLTIGEPRVPLTEAQWAKVGGMLVTLGDAVDSIHGWNEPNWIRKSGAAPSTWIAQTVAHQKRLAQYGAQIGKPVGTPSMWSGTTSVAWTDMGKMVQAGMTSADYDIIDYHLYPRENDTADEIAAFYGKTEQMLRSALSDTTSPFACTEFGLSTAPKQGADNAERVSEEVRAERLRLLVAYQVSRGNRFSWFELVNTLDPSQSNREHWLGIVHADPAWERSPAFLAFKAFLAGE